MDDKVFLKLYPFVNKTGKPPIGHHQVNTENFKDISQYEGLIKCKVLAPRRLHIPVLPMKCNGELMFSLCLSCTEAFQQSSCEHSDNERPFVGTWVIYDLNEAVSQGYTIQNASARTNDIIAAYTTAQARFILYIHLKPFGNRVLYCDTDSIVFTSTPGQWEPQLGDYLADD
ncbi:hypothetical protein MAR_007463 [Mya arenaria]|uniref:DNA-directed DNA polymerase n=1 Tax=Mya arenaria TaxID=6604 RepID=A0ABY7DBF7_MYAAR|nr:hypothetical protein MAR_007463 [Mya arenaria]